MLSRRLSVIALFAATLIAGARAAQYPLSVTFPVGGDAPEYIIAARTITHAATRPRAALTQLTSSWYPSALLLFSTSAALPLDWPERFTWSMAASHLAVGLALAALAARFAGLPAAAAALFFWSLTTTDITRHFEDATLAQLISLGFLALFLERLAAGSVWGSLITFALAVAAHPTTGLPLLVAIPATLPALLVHRAQLTAAERRQAIAISLATLLVIGALIASHKSPFTVEVGTDDETPLDLPNYAYPAVALAPVGLLLMLSRRAVPLPARLTVLSLTAVTVLLAGNIYLGIGVWTIRLRSLAAALATPAAAVALVHTTAAAFHSRPARTVFLCAGAAPLLLAAWHASDRVYRYYENPDNVARLHPAERAAMEWLENHTKPDSTIFSVVGNRHAEWLPALTGRKLALVSSFDKYLSAPVLSSGQHILILTKWNKPPPYLDENELRFKKTFSNEAALVYEILAQ